MLQEMFGEGSVPKMFKGESMYVTVDGKKANIDLLNLVSTVTYFDSLITKINLEYIIHEFMKIKPLNFFK